LAKQIGIRWVDISQMTSTELRKIQPSIYSYDLKYASKVIHGDQSVLDFIPEINPAKLPLKEIEILFFTRLWTLLGSLDENGFGCDLVGENSRFFRNQMAKAILAAVDVLLLVVGAYDASYCERVERIAKLYPGKDDVLKLSRWALTEKLSPQVPMMHPEEIRELYRSVHSLFFREMYRGLSLHFGRPISNPVNIEYNIKWLPKTIMRRLWCFVKFRSLRMEQQISIMLAQSYIAAAWNTDGINEKWLSRGITFLRRIDDKVNHQINWDEARLEVARLRMKI